MNPVGYLVKGKDGLHGERGIYYDYVLAANGLFIEAEGKLLAARIPVFQAEVRGLAPLDPKVVLRHGKIPQWLFDLAMGIFLTDISRERYAAVTWDDKGTSGKAGLLGTYHIVVPMQAGTQEQLAESGDQGHGCVAGVSYLNPDSAILDLHSHGRLRAFFSSQDNRDETGLKIYCVVGELEDIPIVKLRIGVYGYFYTIPWSDVFQGSLIGVEEPKEVVIEL